VPILFLEDWHHFDISRSDKRVLLRRTTAADSSSTEVLGTAMIPDSFATRLLPLGDQLEAWRAWYESVFEVVRTSDPPHNGFSAEVHLWNLGGFAMTRTTAPPVHILRTKSHLRRNPVDHWIISYCVSVRGGGGKSGVSARRAQCPITWSSARA